jgi:hypothetical protein
MPEVFAADSAEPISEAELRSLIARHLPAWQKACDADDAESIVLHEASFGTSTRELFLLAVPSNTPRRKVSTYTLPPDRKG